MGDNFIKVHLDDSKKKNVDLKGIETSGQGIKVIRDPEPGVSSESSYTDSSSEESFKVKKTKKILRKKEKVQKYDFGSFSNPKKTRYEPADSESEYSDLTESEYSEGSVYDEKNDFEEKQKLKQDLLIKIQALEKKGFEFSKKFNMTSSYEEMEFEFSKVKKYIDTQAGIKFARRALMACVTGIEFLNKRFDPFNIKLEGWSENVMESIDDYDNIFEKLHEKYSSKSQVAPEIELLLTLGGSAFMFHLTNSLLKSPMMDFGPIAQNNPNFMASMMGAMNQGLKEAGKPPNFKTQANTGPPPPMETRGMRKEMKGPSMDSHLFSGTPLATNHPNQVNVLPKPPLPSKYPDGPMNMSAADIRNYYTDQHDDDRFSIASSDSSLSSISVGPKTKTIRKKNGGLELNIS
jgi:hypothetical protein